MVGKHTTLKSYHVRVKKNGFVVQQNGGMRLGNDFVEDNDENITRELTNLNYPSGKGR